MTRTEALDLLTRVTLKAETNSKFRSAKLTLNGVHYNITVGYGELMITINGETIWCFGGF